MFYLIENADANIVKPIYVRSDGSIDRVLADYQRGNHQKLTICMSKTDDYMFAERFKHLLIDYGWYKKEKEIHDFIKKPGFYHYRTESWSLSDIEVLKSMYKGSSKRLLMNKFDKTWDQIVQKANSLGLKRRSK